MVKQQDNSKNIKKKLTGHADKDRKIRLNKLFGSIKLEDDSVTLQRRWRDGE